MADYYPLIQRAIAGLDKNTGEARRALYERARTALVAQLRGVNPPLQEAEITRERLALEEAIRKVEADSARRTRVEQPAPTASSPVGSAPRFPGAAGPGQNRPPPPRPPAAAPAGRPGAAAPPPKAAVPPKFAPPGTPRQGRDPGRDPFAKIPGAHDFDRLMEPRLAQEDFSREMRPPGRDESSIEMDPFREAPPPRGRPPRDMRDPEEEFDEEEEDRPRRPIGAIVKALVAVVLVLGIGWLAWSQRGLVTDLMQSFRGSSTPEVAGESKPGQPTAGRPKISDRLGSQDTQSGPAVAQRVVLYEEEPNDPQGKRYVGSAIWRTETVSPGPGRPPELVVRADVEVPERRMTMSFSIRRNTDQTLPASHTMEVMFNLPPDFPAGGISNVPGVLMKQAEQTRGTPLAGLAVKVTNNFFLIGLSAVESDQARNIQLLKERAWFDIPIVYNNNRRAILAIEKGTPGERAFAEAFAAWKQ
ncbi:hypothetical protein [Pseudorhodoplanes sp.]|uniref:hypothetical protein n=1 Tax=Pseudorhodoplanes sp. TaxID=1934341 RepID=UPI003D0CE346